MTEAVQFYAVMKIRGINPYVLVSKSQASRIQRDWKKPMPVLVRVNGQPSKAWPVNLMPTGLGSFYLYLHGEVREASQTKVGDRVEIEIRFNDKYKGGPEGPMPSWFKTPLDLNAEAKKSWTALPPSRKKEILRYITALKSPEARARNVARAMEVLSGKEGRFMARTWKKGA